MAAQKIAAVLITVVLFAGTALPDEICCEIRCYRQAAPALRHHVSTEMTAISGHHHYAAHKIVAPEVGGADHALVQGVACQSYPQIAALSETSKFRIAAPTAVLSALQAASVLSTGAIQPDGDKSPPGIRLFHPFAVALRI